MASVTSYAVKRFQTGRQWADLLCLYVDSAFSSSGLTVNSFDIGAIGLSIFGARIYPNDIVSPIGDTNTNRDHIGSHLYFGNRASGMDVYMNLYNGTSTAYGQQSGGYYPYHVYYCPTIIVYITTDDVWIPRPYIFTFSDTSTLWTISTPSSSNYGFIVSSGTVTIESWTSNFGGNGTIVKNNFSVDLHGNEIEIENDPYSNAGETEEGGGSGNFDYTGDTITEPSLPTVGAAATGFISLFNPNAAQLQSLMDYLWSPLFDLDTIKRLYADPMQQFVGLSLVPVSVPSAGAKTIQVGGISTGISLTAASAQFVRVDCGSITFNSSSLTASYLDFLPYTKTQLYLPYIGCVDISTDDIMNKTMQITYHVDILTGGCIAYIIVGGSVMYQYSGQCAINIPLTSIDWSNTISSALNLVSSAIGGIISGASVPLTGGAGALIGAQGIANMGASAVNAAVNAKPTINKSGAIGGSSGIMSVQKPFLIVTCPNLARAKKQDYFTGYPSFITKYVSDCSGFCSFEEIYLSGLGLTDSEMDELNTIMKEGVYL